MISFFHVCLIIAAALLIISVLLVLIRLLIGPTLPDRVAALDVISILVASIISVFSIATHQAMYLDIVIALALITFLGTVAFAQFIEHQLGHHKEE